MMAIKVIALPGTLLAHGTVPVVPDPRWNGIWREVPARSDLLIPNIVQMERLPNASYRIIADGEAERCRGPAKRKLACAWSGPDRFEVVRRSPGPPPATTRWRVDLAVGTLLATTPTVTPRGPAAVDWHRYHKVGRPGLVGVWRKVADGETPSVYHFEANNGRLHVATADGLVDFQLPLLGRAPAVRDARGHGHVYGAVAPTHLVELSLHGTRLVGRSNLHLAPAGASVVERHVDTQGHVVSVYFMRD